MKEIITTFLETTYERTKKTIPTTQKDSREINITDVKPIHLLEFMKENNIPLDADFCTDYDECLSGANPILIWDIDIPMTKEKQREIFVRRFQSNGFSSVGKNLLKAGYKRLSSNFNETKKYPNIIEMWESGQINELVNYFSLFYKKPE